MLSLHRLEVTDEVHHTRVLGWQHAQFQLLYLRSPLQKCLYQSP